MKFEFVEFYPALEEEKNKKKNILGTVHIYAIDCQLDIRGIVVTKNGRNIFFNIPGFFYKRDDGTRGRYTLIRFTKQETHQEMIDFLKNDVKQIILKTLNKEI